MDSKDGKGLLWICLLEELEFIRVVNSGRSIDCWVFEGD